MVSIKDPYYLFMELYPKVMTHFRKEVLAIKTKFIIIIYDRPSTKYLGHEYYTIDCKTLSCLMEYQPPAARDIDFGIKMKFDDFISMINGDTSQAMMMWYDGKIQTSGKSNLAIGLATLNELVDKLPRDPD
jgi:hypothetical protein